MNELEKFRTRWNRWLGQKCRKEKPYWTTLVNGNGLGGATRVFVKNDINSCHVVAACLDNRDYVKKYFTLAIQYADMKDLYALDSLYCQDKISDR